MQRVQGHCPACGGETLFLANEGYVTCSLLGCPTPTAASDILDDGKETHHLVTFTEGSWTLKHPLIERLNNDLLSCDLFHELSRRDGPPAKPGTYRVRRGDGDSWRYEEVAA